MNIIEKFNLSGKNAFITGGGGGIGKCAAETLAQCGVNVAVVDIDKNNAQSVAESISKQYGVKAIGICADVSDALQVNEMIANVKKEFGILHIAFNNAGIARHCNVEDLTIEVLDSVLAVNLHGVFLTAQAAARMMIESGTGGSIINTASICSHIINRPQKSSAYCISKGGVLLMTKSMAVEWARFNIRVNSISPGYVYSDLTKNSPNVPLWEEMVPMKRLAQPEDIVGALLYLSSDAAAYTTGCDILVDGGYTCW